MKLALLLVGHLRDNPRLSLSKNLEFIQNTFGVAGESITVFISTYDVRGDFLAKDKNYDDVNTPWIDSTPDPGMAEDLNWLASHSNVALLDCEVYADTSLAVAKEVDRLLAHFGIDSKGAGLIASGVAQARKLVRLYDLAGLAHSDFDLVVKSRPDAWAKLDRRKPIKPNPRNRQIFAVGEHRYVVACPDVKNFSLARFPEVWRPFMNDIVYWAANETFLRWVNLQRLQWLHPNPLQYKGSSDSLHFATLRSLGQPAHWAMPELTLGRLARSNSLKIKTLSGSIERKRHRL